MIFFCALSLASWAYSSDSSSDESTPRPSLMQKIFLQAAQMNDLRKHDYKLKAYVASINAQKDLEESRALQKEAQAQRALSAREEAKYSQAVKNARATQAEQAKQDAEYAKASQNALSALSAKAMQAEKTAKATRDAQAAQEALDAFDKKNNGCKACRNIGL